MFRLYDQHINFLWLEVFLNALTSSISSLAWPISAIVCTYLIRDHLFKFLHKIKRAKFAGAEFDLEEATAVVIDNASDRGITVFRNTDTQNDPDAPIDYALLNFMVDWQAIEKMFRDYDNVHRKGITHTTGSRPITQIINDAYKQHLIDANLFKTLIELRNLRNIIMHDIASIYTNQSRPKQLLGLLQSVKERVTAALQ